MHVNRGLFFYGGLFYFYICLHAYADMGLFDMCVCVCRGVEYIGLFYVCICIEGSFTYACMRTERSFLFAGLRK